MTTPKIVTGSQAASEPAGSQQRMGMPQREWVVTRTIVETYGAQGATAEEAINYVNEAGPGASTVKITKESAKRVRHTADLSGQPPTNL